MNNEKPSYEELEKELLELKNQIQVLDKLNQQSKKETPTTDDIYINLVNHSPYIFYKYSSKRGRLFWSEKVQDILGFAPDENKYSPFLWVDSIHPDDKPKVQKAIEDNAKGADYNIEYRIKTKAGKYIWLHDYFIHKSQIGDEIIIEGQASDITKRKKIEEEVRNYYSLLETILESTEDGMLVVDKSGKIIKYNNKFVELWNIPDEILKTNDDEKLIASVLSQLADPKSFLEKVQKIYTNDERIFDTLQFKDGRIYERYSQPFKIENKTVGRVWSFRNVTDRTNAIIDLTISEQKYRTLVNEVKEGYFVSDINGKLTFVNIALAQILGFKTPEEVTGKQFYSFLPQELINQRQFQYQSALATGTTNVFSTEIIRNDGTKRFIEINSQIIIEHNKPIGTRGLIHDITKQKLTEIALFENQKRFEKSQELGHVGNWEYKFDTNTFWASDESKRIYGFNLNENNIAIDRVRKCIPESDRLDKALDDLVNHNIKYDLEFEILPEDGSSPKHIHSIAELERDKDNMPKRVWGVIIDITQQKHAEKELKSSKKRLTQAQEIAHLGHWELNIQKNRLIWSDEVYNMFEVKRDVFEPSYEAFLNNIHPDDREMVDHAYKSSLENKTDYKVQHRLLLKSGKLKYVEERCHTEYDEEGKPLRSLGTVLDITELKKTQMLLEQSIATKDKFFSIIAHDLRSPFNNILGFTELLLQNTEDLQAADLKKYVKIINSTADNTLVLLDNLLNWARSQTGKIRFNPQLLTLSEIFADISSLSVSRASKKNITISFFDSGDTTVYADPDMLNTIIRNLISNAIKFTNPNGKIDIYTLKNENSTEISVKDNGIGMTAETVKKIFDPEPNISTPGTANEKGSGLGLLLCKEFVEKHGGSIHLKSDPGKGSTFTLKLPDIKVE